MSAKKRSSTKARQSQRVSARERVAAARAAEKRRERTRWIITFSITGVVVALLAAGAVWAIAKDNKPAALPQVAAAQGTGTPPWPLPADTMAGARAAGLVISPMEGTAKHFHAHLDVLVNGQKVAVPANLGIEQTGQQLAELHTHDASGVLHVEAPSTSKRYTLGQVFNEWNVRLNSTAIGGLTVDAGHTLTAYVDGKAQTGDPASIELTTHREIALVYGPKGQQPQVPSSYSFANGE